MTAILAPPLVFQSFTPNGIPNAFGTLASYIAGTTTPQATYVDSTQTTQNLNPATLNNLGQLSLWLDPAKVYKFLTFDQAGNQIGFVDQVQGSLTAAALGSALTQAIVGAALYPQTAAELAASVVPTNFQYETTPLPVMLRYGGDPTGVADSRAAFNTASTVNVPFVIPTGTFLVNSNVTITPSVLFEPGAILKPAAGVTITLSNAFQAGAYQIFDLSLGGVVLLPTFTGEARAVWWGAQALPSAKVNNEVAFNMAWWALLQTAGGTIGGTIIIERGDFFKSGTSYHSDNISYRGEGFLYSLVKANAGTWVGSNMFQSQSATPITFTDNAGLGPLAGATSATLSVAWALATTTYPVVFFERGAGACEQRTVTLTNGATTATWSGGLNQNCTANAVALGYTAIFNNRIECVRLDANNVSAISSVIYAPAWQEKSGTDNVYIANFLNFGILIDNGYGGAAQIRLNRTEIFASQAAAVGAACIRVNLPAYGVGFLSVDCHELSIGASSATVTFTAGVAATAVSATLAAPWPNPTGLWNVWFVESSGGAIEVRYVTLTNGATTATWSLGLTNACTANASGINPGINGFNMTGGTMTGGIIVNCDDVHGEQLQSLFVLGNRVNVVGNSITCDGNPSCQYLFTCGGSWLGYINAFAVQQAGAINLIVDSNRDWALSSLIPADGNLIWPPISTRPVAAANVTGAGVPVLSSSVNIASVANQGVGQQRLTFATPAAWSSGITYFPGNYVWLVGTTTIYRCILQHLNQTPPNATYWVVSGDGTAPVDIVASSMDSVVPIIAGTMVNGNQFDVFTKNTTIAGANAGQFTVKVYHRS